MDLIQQINNSEHWPSFENPNFMQELDDLASRAIKQNTIEGYLAALLIYHQLCEEMVRLLIADSRFFIELSIHPAKIKFPKRNRPMFGSALAELGDGIEFPEKESFISKCSDFNQRRNQIVHKLTKKTTLGEVEKNLENIASLYEDIYRIFDDSHDWYRVCFKDFKKDVFIDYFE
ncbi:MAG: hypothetical protein KF886_23955 [Candidatus Hydrogenedentes bacterium]|nr:hypothetical protein [Candidatus Hydrogenedentota bacterium]